MILYCDKYQFYFAQNSSDMSRKRKEVFLKQEKLFEDKLTRSFYIKLNFAGAL